MLNTFLTHLKFCSTGSLAIMAAVQQDTGANEMCCQRTLVSTRTKWITMYHHWISTWSLKPGPQLFLATLGFELMARSQRQSVGSHLWSTRTRATHLCESALEVGNRLDAEQKEALTMPAAWLAECLGWGWPVGLLDRRTGPADWLNGWVGH